LGAGRQVSRLRARSVRRRRSDPSSRGPEVGRRDQPDVGRLVGTAGAGPGTTNPARSAV